MIMSASSLMLTSRSCPRLTGPVEIRIHQPADSLDAIVDVAEGAGLFAVAPDLDRLLALEFGHRHLARERGGRLLPAAFPFPERAEHVVEADDVRLYPELSRGNACTAAR